LIENWDWRFRQKKGLGLVRERGKIGRRNKRLENESREIDRSKEK